MIKEPSVLLSFIIPVYNGEKYIERCIESIKKSCIKYLDIIEIIVINDGSKDRTKDILRPYIVRGDIHYHEQDNQGVSVARNSGIKKAIGEYIAFIDADDFVDISYLETLYPLIQKHSDMVCFDIYRTDLNNFELDLHIQKKTLSLPVHFGINEYLLGEMEKKMSASPCNKLYKRKIIVDNKLQFLEGRTMSEDLIFNAEYMEHIKSIDFVDKGLFYYFYNENSIMNSYNPTYVDSVRGFIPDVMNLCKKYSVIQDNDKITRMYLNRWFGVLSNETRNTSYKQGFAMFKEYIDDRYFLNYLPTLPNKMLTKKQIIYKYLTLFHLSAIVYKLVYLLKK